MSTSGGAKTKEIKKALFWQLGVFANKLMFFIKVVTTEERKKDFNRILDELCLLYTRINTTKSIHDRELKTFTDQMLGFKDKAILLMNGLKNKETLEASFTQSTTSYVNRVNTIKTGKKDLITTLTDKNKTTMTVPKPNAFKSQLEILKAKARATVVTFKR